MPVLDLINTVPVQHSLSTPYILSTHLPVLDPINTVLFQHDFSNVLDLINTSASVRSCQHYVISSYFHQCQILSTRVPVLDLINTVPFHHNFTKTIRSPSTQLPALYQLGHSTSQPGTSILHHCDHIASSTTYQCLCGSTNTVPPLSQFCQHHTSGIIMPPTPNQCDHRSTNTHQTSNDTAPQIYRPPATISACLCRFISHQ